MFLSDLLRMILMKMGYLFSSMFFLLLIVSCGNNTEAEEIELKINIKNAESEKPRHELVFYLDGRKIAERVYEKGRLILSEGDIPDGKVVQRYENGKVKNIFTYKNGKRNGKAFGYYESGRLKKEVTFLDDNPIGIEKMYYENGNLMVEAEIVDGKQVFYKEYYQNGQLKQEVYYEADKIIRKIYDINGRLIHDVESGTSLISPHQK
jgi:antitoxin component YwqK of YwqJK toxin-antitoxin module